MSKTPNWDKRMNTQLTELGLNWELAQQIVGLIAEERQLADREGYVRGYNNGYRDAISKINRLNDK